MKAVRSRAVYRSKVLRRANYLNYGDALEHLIQMDGHHSQKLVRKPDLVPRLVPGQPSEFVREVIRTYGGTTPRLINVEELRSDVAKSVGLRGEFERIRCRGFSYCLKCDLTGFPYRLRSRINLRIALVAQRDLFYPPHVRQFVMRHRLNHYFVNGDPAIAFALGIATKSAWFVFVLQSDLVRRGNASVREHFRGWRRVLFAELLTLAAGAVPDLYLMREEDVLRTCHEDHSRPSSVPPLWNAIYGGTARDFGLSITTLPRAINVQLYDRKRPIHARSFYHLSTRAHRRPATVGGEDS